ncbi:MAG: hypothetical protein ACE5HE_13270, partial [Phycisphaerae bacterium]
MSSGSVHAASTAQPTLRVVCIDELEGFERLRSTWDSVYASDPRSHIFVSWAWLNAWFQVTPFEWLVLAAQPRESEDFVAFLPLATTTIGWGRAALRRELHLGGKPLADYTGLLSIREYESQAVDAFARYILDDIEWDVFCLADVLDDRLSELKKHLSGEKLHLTNGVANACPYMALP